MLNTRSAGTSAIFLSGHFAANLRNSAVTGAGDGIFAGKSIVGAVSRVNVANSMFTHNGNAAIETGGTGNLGLAITDSLLHQNNAVVLHGAGTILIEGNIMTNNANSLVNCGTASIGSLGNNVIANNTDTTLPPGCSACITPGIFGGK